MRGRFAAKMLGRARHHHHDDAPESTLGVIQGLHHNAYRCRDAEETRRFYEGFLGLPLACSLRREVTETGEETDLLHIFFEMADGSYLAFFDVPGKPFEFKEQDPSDLHIALEVSEAEMKAMMAKSIASVQSVVDVVKKSAD